MGFKKADDFYVAIGGGKVPVGQVVNKVLQRLKTTEVRRGAVARDAPRTRARASARRRSTASSSTAPTDPDVLVRMAKCCTPVPGDPITGYISVGRGITIHRDDCPNVRALMRSPERFCPVSWDGDAEPVVPRRDRRRRAGTAPRLLEDIGRTFAENGCNIVEYGGVTQDQMAQELVRRRGRRRQAAEEPCSRRCATSSRCSTRTASRRARARSTDACRSWSATTCARRSRVASRRYAASRSTSRKVRRSACSGRTAPARPPRCACSARC